MKTTKQIYYEIFEVLEKYKNVCIFDIDDMKRQSECHLYGIELKETFGLEIDPKEIRSLDWNKFGEFMSICKWGNNHNRKISWPDDGKQPKDELLLEISFPTGPYIFGNDYPDLLFQKFFLELKGFNPKYTDTHNNNLYFSMDNAKDVFNSFDAILNKYQKINADDFKQRRILKMEAELNKLKSINP